MMSGHKIGNWVQNEMLNDHKIENRSQNEPTVGHKSWNNRFWYRNRIQNKLMGGHNSWSINWQTIGRATSRRATAPSQLAKLWASDQTKGADDSRLASTRQRAGQWCRQGIQQPEGTDVTERWKPSTVFDSGQVCCVGRGSTFACVQRHRRQTRDD